MFKISTPGDLLEYRSILNSPQRCGAYLTNDIDMAGVDWKFPMTVNERCNISMPVFEGNGYSIRNLSYRPDAFICAAEVCPTPGAYPIKTKMTGILFENSCNFIIRNLTVQGHMELTNNKSFLVHGLGLIAGGLPGHVGRGGAIENCRVEVDITYDYNFTHVVAGITGALEGIMKDCVFAGNIRGGTGIGLAYMHNGLIENSYSENQEYPDIMSHINYDKGPKGKRLIENFQGLIDNIGLYMPGQVLHAGSFRDFFASETIMRLLQNDVQLNLPVTESYWAKAAVPKIADVIESMSKNGASFDTRSESPASCSLLPFRHITTARKLYAARYCAMIETLILKSPVFREALLQEMSIDSGAVIDKLGLYLSNKKRIVSILRKAKRLEEYENSVEADCNYAAAAFER